MCPDKSILSAYYDGEVNEPWKSKLANHIKSCESCRNQLLGYGDITHFLDKEEHDSFEQTPPILYSRVMQQHRRNRIIPFRERINMWPLTAAAFLVMSFSFLIYSPVQRRSNINGTLVLFENSKPGLSAMDNLVPIMLPPEQKFSYYGDSQLIKVAGIEGSVMP